jgi:two-component system sensor kinase FixL
VKPREALFSAAFIAGYVGLDWLSYIHPMEGFNITPWNPQPGLAIALMIRGGFRWVPLVYVALLASEWLSRGNATPTLAVLGIAAVLCAGYGLIAHMLRGPLRINPVMDSQQDAVRLVLAVALGAFINGALFIAALMAWSLLPLDDPPEALVRFWIGDAVGILVTLPLVLMLSVRPRRMEVAAMLHRRETIVHVALIVLAMALVLLVQAEDLVKFFYVLFIPLIVVATRLGLVGSTFAALGLQCAIIVSSELADYQALTIFEVQALLIALTVTGLFLGVSVDERRRVQQELGRTLRMAAAGEMAAALAHELNQPLAAVGSYARASQLIAGSARMERELLIDTLAKLVNESSRAAEVVRRLRDFFTTGDTHLEPVDLGSLAQRVAQRVRATSPDTLIEVTAATGGPEVLADGTQLEVVVRNLLANAIEASTHAQRPQVDVEVDRVGGDAVRLSVRDNGPGVTVPDSERIFDAFETTRATGMGMGLAISRAIIEAHGGRIWAEPGSRGHFAFTLPARRAP